MQQDPSRPRGFHFRWRHVLIAMIVPIVLVPVAVADTGAPAVTLPCAGQLPSQVPNPITCPAGGGSGTSQAGQKASRQPAQKRAGTKCTTSVKHNKHNRKLRANKNQRHKHSHVKHHKRGQSKKRKRC